MVKVRTRRKKKKKDDDDIYIDDAQRTGLCTTQAPEKLSQFVHADGVFTFPRAVNRSATSEIIVPLIMDSSTINSDELEQP